MLKRREDEVGMRNLGGTVLGIGGGAAARLLLALLCAAVAVLTLASGTALAQDGEQVSPEDPIDEKSVVKTPPEETLLDCKDIATRRGAQAYFDLYPTDRFALDKDNDGLACETASGATTAEDGTALGAATGGDLRDCADFASQAAAQNHLRNNPHDPYAVDVDNDGIACQITFTEYDDPAQDLTPVVGANFFGADLDCQDFEFQQESQMVYFEDVKDPNDLDASANNDGSKVCLGLPTMPSNTFAVSAVPEENGGVATAETVALTPLAQAMPTRAVDRAALLIELCALLLVVSGAGILFAVWRKG
jgi:hypothetical protein